MIARFATALAMLVVLLGGSPHAGAAGTIQITRAELQESVLGDDLQLAADIYLPISEPVREALALGVPLYFVLEFIVVEPRWYWRDRIIVSEHQRYRLSYHPVTRRFRVTRFGFPQEYLDLDQALASLSRVRGWSVVPLERLEVGQPYEAAVRLRLDTERLPGPLQIDLFTTRDWNLESEWKRFPLTLEKVTSEP